MDFGIYKNCRLCPRECAVDRTNGEHGFCGADSELKIARAALHFWEEPCISGDVGSGAVFFSGCTLGCVFCQNYEISRGNTGYKITEEELAAEFIRLQDEGAANINLVTPTHYLPGIVRALDIAKHNGLILPIVYNCGGYEKAETIKMLNGYIDVYLPDMKYYSDKYSYEYSCAQNYNNIAKSAIAEMYRQTGACKFSDNGIIKSGVIVRHLLLPGLLFEAKKVVDYIYDTYGGKVWLSLMSQYTPMPQVENDSRLNRRVTNAQYSALVDYCAEVGMTNVYIQDTSSADSCYIPEFFSNK